ncbi:MAG: PIN domain-containing protein [Thermoleophilia bacterium]|nr:PIN domain-containing protein [Thermoleophilia bacterium]
MIAGELALSPVDTAAISVVTIGELRAGVLLASDPSTRTARQARFSAIRDAFEPISVDEGVAERYGEVLAGARATRCITTATDLLIVATAAATGRSLCTLDQSQARLAERCGVATVG